jgi:MYXO-CTERM domain-containing protein
LTGLGVPGGILVDSVLRLPGQSSISQSGTFIWSVDLVPGGFASFDITGDVAAQGIPEPDALALAALGLVGLVAVRRRRRLAP